MTAPIDIECPACKSGAGNYCKSETNRPGTYMQLVFHHAARVDAAARDTGGTQQARQDDPERLREALRAALTLLGWYVERASDSMDRQTVANLRKEFGL